MLPERDHAEPVPVPVPGQRNEATQRGRVHAVQYGNQINVDHLHLALDAADRSVPTVSVTPPLGRRDPGLPVRGREDLLCTLLSLFDSAADACRVRVLCGLAGSGKTTVALELAHWATSNGIAVWWVDATAAHGITAGLLAVARQLGVPGEELRYGDAADRLWRCLNARVDPWLLVLDNVDRPEALAGTGRLADGTGWLRPVPGGAGLVVVTSRDGDADTWGPWCVPHPIETLTAADAAQVLCDHAGGAGDPAAARLLAERLGGLPLALQMAGAYLADTAAVPWADADTVTTFDGYRAALEGGSRRAAGWGMTDSPADEHRYIIGRAWELALDLLVERGMPEARQLLRLLSNFAAAPIPYRLLLHPATMAGAPMFTDLTPVRLWRLLRGLAALGLIELPRAAEGRARDVDGALATLRVHPLVRDVGRLMGAGQPDASLTLIASRLLIRVVRNEEFTPPQDPRGWPAWQAIAAHAVHLAVEGLSTPDVDEVAEDVMTCAINAVRHLRARGMFEAAEPAYRQLYVGCCGLLGEDHPYGAQIRHELGYTLYYRGLLTAAEQEFTEVLRIRWRVLGEDHPDTLLTRHALARILRIRGEFTAAEALLREIYPAQRRMLGDDHPDTLTTQHQLARVLHNLGALDDAHREFQQVLRRRRRTLGERHPDTLMTLHQLAYVIHRQGRLADAEGRYRTVLELRRETLGDEHPDTLHTRHRLAALLVSQGRLEDAEIGFRDVLEVRTRLFGAEHPDTLTTRYGLADVLAELGRTAEAVAEFRQVHRARRRVLGDEHPDTLLTHHRLVTPGRGRAQS